MASYIIYCVSVLFVQILLSSIFWKKSSELYRIIPKWVLYCSLAFLAFAIFVRGGWEGMGLAAIGLPFLIGSSFTLIIFGLLRYQSESKQAL